jgi:hypothetical protein
MPRHHDSDQFSKNILRDALSRACVAETEVEVLAATQRIDVYAVPDPARAVEREEMGLLGELSAEPSLFEPFRNTPSLARIRRCMCKQLAWHHELERRARAASGKAEEDLEADAPQVVPFPWLVVISPGRAETVLELYGCKQVRPGLYSAVAGLQMSIIVLAELPRRRDTLLLRLVGSGRVLAEALAEHKALPADAWERRVVTPLVLHFGREGPPANEEDDVSAEIQAWYEEYERSLRTEGAARAVLTVLRARSIAVSDRARERIVAEKDPERLERWLEKAATAASVAEVLDEPS